MEEETLETKCIVCGHAGHNAENCLKNASLPFLEAREESDDKTSSNRQDYMSMDSEKSSVASDQGEKQTIIDQTETNLIALRRTIYLTIQSALDFEECAHKLLRLELKPGQEVRKCLTTLN